MENHSAAYADDVDVERAPYRLTATSDASLRMATMTAPRSSWALPTGETPLGYLPRQVLRPAG